MCVYLPTIFFHPGIPLRVLRHGGRVVKLYFCGIYIPVMKTSSVSTHFDGRPCVQMTEPPRVAIFASGREINERSSSFFSSNFSRPLLLSARQSLQLSCMMVASRELCRYTPKRHIIIIIRATESAQPYWVMAFIGTLL